MIEKHDLVGTLLGEPFLASVDCDGMRKDKDCCALVVTQYLVPPGYRAYILSEQFPEEYAKNLAAHCPDASIVYGVPGADLLRPFDVIDVSEAGVIRRAYADGSEDNVLFITNQCNSNCIMCPDGDASRKRILCGRKDYLKELIDLIPTDTPHLTITGGEPTLLKWDLIELLCQCKERFPETEFLMLSNGRTLCVDEYRNAFLEAIPVRFQLGVPLYGDNAAEHDAITRAKGSFEQTAAALRHLQDRVRLELRIVVMKSNYRRLPAIAEYIIKKFPNTATVSMMGMELLGNAAIQRDSLWVDFAETAPWIEEAALRLIRSGIDAKIYNYPLCSLPRRLWPIAAKSISGHKVRYKPECDRCTAKCHCGGFFFSTIRYEKVRAVPITEEL